MNILDLPDEVLVNLFDKYLCRDQLVAIHLTCQRFRIIIDHYDLWCKYLLKVPAIDYNYPFGNLFKIYFLILLTTTKSCLI